MRKIICIVLLLLTIGRVNGQTTVKSAIAAYSADRLMKRVAGNDTLYIINFWATWCAPCVKELPVFDSLQLYYKGKPVKIMLVSLDFKESYPKKLAAYITKRHLLPEVVWFNETDANTFIPKIDNSWSGSIPATLIINKTQSFRQFIEGTVHFDEIKKIADSKL